MCFAANALVGQVDAQKLLWVPRVSDGLQTKRNNFGADDFAGYHQFHPTILLAPFRRFIRSDWPRLAEARRGRGRFRNSLLRQITPHTLGALLGKLLIERFGPDAVGVASNGQPQRWIRENNAGDFGQLFAGQRTKRVFAGIEQHVGHIDDQPARGVACFQN